jgi:hypothetical protein
MRPARPPEPVSAQPNVRRRGRDARESRGNLRAIATPVFWRSLVSPDSPVWIVLLIVVPIVTIGLELTAGGWFMGPAPGVDKDFWWHLATGEWVLDHHRIPTTDPFSWNHGGQEWVAHEWLAGTLIAILWRIGGYGAGVIFTIVVATFGFWRFLDAARFYGLSRRAAALLMLLWGGAFFRIGVIVVRPQVWSWAMLGVLCAELAAYDTGRRKQLWVLPPLFVVWMSVNLTALIGLGCLGAFLLDRLIRRQLNRHLFVVGALSGMSLLANPSPVKLIELIVQYLDEDMIYRQAVLEWMPPRWGDSQNNPFWLALPLLIPAVWFLVKRRPHVWPAAPLLVLAYQSFQAIRYIPIYILLCLVMAGWVAGEIARRRDAPAPAEPMIPRRRWVAVPIAGAAAAMLLLAWAMSPTQLRRDPHEWYFPSGATDAYLANYSGLRLFNTYDFGGYLIYRFQETGDTVSMDGRSEMYGYLAVRLYFYYVFGS